MATAMVAVAATAGRTATIGSLRAIIATTPAIEERRLSSQDEVYRGEDGRYYCRRSDGTTGLVIGAGVGALTGRAIDGGRNRATGTIVGGVLGALIGREVERSQDLRCR